MENEKFSIFFGEKIIISAYEKKVNDLERNVEDIKRYSENVVTCNGLQEGRRKDDEEKAIPKGRTMFLKLTYNKAIQIYFI